MINASFLVGKISASYEPVNINNQAEFSYLAN